MYFHQLANPMTFDDIKILATSLIVATVLYEKSYLSFSSKLTGRVKSQSENEFENGPECFSVNRGSLRHRDIISRLFLLLC